MPSKPGEGVITPGAGIEGGEPSGGCWEFLLTKEQQVLLTIKPFLQPLTGSFLENEYKKIELSENEKKRKRTKRYIVTQLLVFIFKNSPLKTK